MIRTLARLALTAAAGSALWSLRRQFMPEQNDPKPKAKHPAVQTWEGEGGALPDTGSQVGPDPVVPASAETAVAPMGSDAGRWPASAE
jgi:hypothetical protein